MNISIVSRSLQREEIHYYMIVAGEAGEAGATSGTPEAETTESKISS